GQSSDPNAASYDPDGLALQPGLCELVEPGDPLAGSGDRNVGKIKLRVWRGPLYVDDPTRDVAGVDWILAEDWWPYQRPSFVTPPFAGYVSGHSTYSRAAAEVLATLTGSEFFPGGLAEYRASANNYLVFERGPSTDVTLQWATFVDAADQSGLSRIFGGIHPPMDDVPGRVMGAEVARLAVERANTYFAGSVP
ncbi:MAG: vanadium-dependent haloperoxidase, partial [Myxococcota bacterium]